jgi:tRNA(adenine34) deaminase
MNITEPEIFMLLAIEEAMMSLREGNCGFGAVIAKNNELIAKAHDTEKTNGDSTAHAEMTVIRSASDKLGRDLSGCVLIATHEPCPMCATAVIWSGITEIAFGYSIKDAIKQGRKRIDLSCKELFKRAGKEICVNEALLQDQCSILYNKAVRDSVDQLRDADTQKLEALAEDLSKKRLRWYAEQGHCLATDGEDILHAAYRVFLQKLGISEDQAPIVRCDEKHLILHSRNFCPTLEACNVLGLDTGFVCKYLTEKPTTDLIRQIHPKLRFTRNYKHLRPHSDYCEEMIILGD